jgi:hypothetical protein
MYLFQDGLYILLETRFSLSTLQVDVTKDERESIVLELSVLKE